MSMLDATPSDNSNGSHAWAASWRHLSVERRGHGYCRVTFDHPPMNTVTATMVAELAELVELIEEDDDLNVVVFGSANPDFYLADHDTRHDPRGWADLLVRLARAPVVSIASIRGRAQGAGSEFALACDMRFASRENTRLGQFKAGTAQLSRLVGRGRALEMLLLADDLDGPRAELYGCVNRTIADDRLDDEVEQIAVRLDRFDHEAIGLTKSYVG
jgi:enoyl-CoA hydratase/carnithine racemase